MLRELILFTADLTQTAWYQSGEPPPVPDVEDIAFQTVEGSWPDSLAVPENVPELAAVSNRLQRGNAGIIGTSKASGDIVYCIWLSNHATRIDWIFSEVSPPVDHAFIYNAWVHPDWRGSNLHWAGAAHACRGAVSRGTPRLFAGVERHEFKPFATKYAQMGLAVIRPHGSLWGLRLLGLSLHWRRPARAELVHVSDDLSARFGVEVS